MKYWKKKSKFKFYSIFKNSYKIQTTFHQYQKLYSTPWHGARTCKVSRKYINAFLSYSAKTKRDGQTDGRTDGRTDRQTDRQTDGRTDRRTGGHCNISRPGPSAPREIIKCFFCVLEIVHSLWHWWHSFHLQFCIYIVVYVYSSLSSHLCICLKKLYILLDLHFPVQWLFLILCLVHVGLLKIIYWVLRTLSDSLFVLNQSFRICKSLLG